MEEHRWPAKATDLSSLPSHPSLGLVAIKEVPMRKIQGIVLRLSVLLFCTVLLRPVVLAQSPALVNHVDIPFYNIADDFTSTLAIQ